MVRIWFFDGFVGHAVVNGLHCVSVEAAANMVQNGLIPFSATSELEVGARIEIEDENLDIVREWELGENREGKLQWSATSLEELAARIAELNEEV